MTNLAIYHSNEVVNEILEEFIDAYYGQRMHYFASDLLKENFSPEEIMTAVRRAMNSCRLAGVDVQKHFNLVYTTLNGAIVRDCKLTNYGYGMVLLNGPTNNKSVAEWQSQLVNDFIKRQL